MSGADKGAATHNAVRNPTIRKVGRADIALAFRDGLADFTAVPFLSGAFGFVYLAGGLFILYSLARFDSTWMIIPVAIGFPLIAPFIAAGLYEISRRLSAGEVPEWRSVLTVVVQQQRRELGWMAFTVFFVFWIWIYQVRLLLAIFLGMQTFTSVDKFISVITTTPEGIGFLLVGSLVGTVLATVLYSVTVIAMPMLLDRDVDFVTAMITSVKTVRSNPVVMLGWGAMIGAAAIVALVPAFLLIPVVLPILGHTTWHLYKRVIIWDEITERA